MRTLAGMLALSLMCAVGQSADKPDDLARMAGEWVAVSSTRTGQIPPTEKMLAKITLKIEKDQWTQSFDKDTATWTITPANGAMTMRHNKTGAVIETTYVLKGDKLTVTRVIDPNTQETEVKVWRRKGIAG